ncbi:HAMP domain-containing histidine kinase [bacterium]|nr:HAMP domain-containing histidine kinase [bacterium]
MKQYSILKKVNTTYVVILVLAFLFPLGFNAYFNISKYNLEKIRLIKISNDFSSDKISEAYLLNNLALVNQTLRNLCVELDLATCEFLNSKKDQIYFFKLKNISKNSLSTYKYPLIYNGKTLGWLNFSYQPLSFWRGLFSKNIHLVPWLVLFMFLSTSFLRNLIKSSLERFNDISKAMEDPNLSLIIENIKAMSFSMKEVESLKIKIQNNLEKVKDYEEISKETEKLKVETSIARQVAHDIRSPLTALNVVSKDLSGLQEGSRVLLRSSIQRIQDIANNLVSKSDVNAQDEGESSEQEILESVLLLPIIEEIVSEKRYQQRSKADVDIVLESDKAYGLFAKVDEHVLKRVISNLINNSVEAFKGTGEVVVQVAKCLNSDEIVISVKDNGKGIPKDVLPKLGERGASFGKEGHKESGSGLGLYHAKSNVEKWGGRFVIESEQGKGTEIQLYLPKTEAPDWFVPRINLQGIKSIVILDDDESIHQVWDKRLDVYIKEHNIDLKHARCPEAFEKLVQDREGLLCLCDYELLGYEETGLDLIERNKLENIAILITSRYAEETVQGRCKKLGIKLIPKTSADLVPLTIEKSQNKVQYDAVLIDDDEMIRNVWQMAADDDNKRILTFADPALFDEQVKKIDLQTPIYIDQNLKNKQLGTEVAKSIAKRGFKNLYLATGEEAYRVKQTHDTSIFTKIVDKNPPWV